MIGAGSSGVQIADELREPDARCGCRWERTTARRVAIVSDFAGGSGAGNVDAAANAPGKEHVTIAVSGARRPSVDFRQLAHQGSR